MSDDKRKPKPRSTPASRAAARRLLDLDLFKFEHKQEPLLPLGQFWARLARSVMWGVVLIGGSLMIGVAGYHWIAGLNWVDSILNASMILTGMGPVDRMESDTAKLFASAYALFSGVAFLSSVGVLLAPVIHRLMHHFHVVADETDRS